jgi:hypothetical protein
MGWDRQVPKHPNSPLRESISPSSWKKSEKVEKPFPGGVPVILFPLARQLRPMSKFAHISK